ncbi:MAG: 3-deoxy-D-manno-octulosonic acid transferase [Rhodobacteraceae bacterium]|nr:3-deoxy-D-manno-octulosonic acid transferase [Paracoccaceae bacterium]
MSEKASDQKSLGLSVYSGLAKYASPLAERRAQRSVEKGEEDAVRIQERYGNSSIVRADGLLFWLHSSDLGHSLGLMGLMGRLKAVYPDATFLLTTSERVSEQVMAVRLPIGAIHQYVPYDIPRAVESFLAHWQPDICLWVEDRLMPVLFQETITRNIPALYLNADAQSRSFRRLRWMPGVASSVMNLFSAILAIDEEAASGLQKLGASPDKISVAGVLREGSVPLPANEAMRSHVARQLQGRPVWLAVHVNESEEDMVIEAHKMAQRSTHRLLSIISPLKPERIKGLSAKLVDSDLNFICRSDWSSLTPLTEVLLADVPNELGLWYRIASVSLVGNSLTSEGRGGNPDEPAALGSAIIHGPHVEDFADSFFRLASVGAAVEILTVESLAEVISELMSPDKAAEMAHAAWVANSEGAEVTDQVIEMVVELLGPQGDEA